MLASILGLEKRAVQGPSFTAADYQQLVLSDPDFSVGLTEHEALSTAAVWQAIELLSGDLAKLPLEKLRKDADGRWQRHESHPTWRVVHDRPTENIGAFKWWRRFYVQLLLWSNAYARINTNGSGEVESLTLLESSMVSHTHNEDGEWGFWYLGETGDFEFLLARQVIHVEDVALHRTAVRGRARDKPLRMIDQARKHFNLNLMVERYGTKFFEHGGRIGGWLQLPREMTKKAKDRYEEQFRSTYENIDAAFRVVIHRGEGELRFHPASQADPEKTQLVDARKEQVRDAARWFNIPPHKLGDDTRVSFNSLEQENKSYLDSTLSPRLLAVQDECKCKLLRLHERNGGLHMFRHDVSALLQVDAATAMTIAKEGYINRLLTQNEGRRKIGEQPVDGGDDFLVTPVGGVPSDTPPEDEPETEPEADDEPEEDELRFVRIPLIDALQRCLSYMEGVVQRKARGQTAQGFAHWMQHRLEAYVKSQVEIRLRAAIDAYSGQAKIDENALFERLFRALCQEIRNQVQTQGKLQIESCSLLLLERIENAR